MRKFTYIDVHNWKVVGVNGEVFTFTRTTKDGKKEVVTNFNGYRSALQAAKKVEGGTPVRE